MSTEEQIGAKILTPPMMECIFQYTDSVLETIRKIRVVADKSQDAFCDRLLKKPNEALMDAHGYNNAISVLGSRGAGKTSVIMTLQTILRVGKPAWKSGNYSDYSSGALPENNIIMPILVPQDFANGQSLLSWVIMQLCRKGEEIEEEIAKDYLSVFAKNGPLNRWMPANKTDYSFDPLRECMNSLIRSFELRYRLDSNRLGLEDDRVFEFMDEVKHDSSIVFEMLKLVSMMADYYRYRDFQFRTSRPADQNNEPLFFFVIDDLDLAPARSQEILNLILRYLQHPNIVILCGWNQELFQSHLCVDLFKNQGVLNTSLLNTNLGYDDVFMKRQRKRVAVLDSARRLAMDNLKKAFPPSQRYEIRGLTTKQRAFFPYRIDEELKRDSDSLLPLIEQALSIGKVQITPSFLRNYCGEYMFVYMRIFDNKARGLINVRCAFLTLLSRISQWDRQDNLDLTAELKSLLNTILFSNTHFAPYLRGLRDLIKIEKVVLDKDGKKSDPDFFCDYKSVKKVFQAYQSKGEKYSLEYLLEREYNYFPSVIIDVFVLLNFVENMILQLCGKPRYEHGGIAFSSVLNSINKPVDVEKETGSQLSLALFAAGIARFPLFPEIDDFRINLVLLDYYEKEGFSDQNYDFSGLYGYRKLMQAVYNLTQYSGQKQGSLPKHRVDWLRRQASDWTALMESVFDALLFSHEHVMRLSIYRSFVLQGLNDQYGEYLKTATYINTQKFQALLGQKSLFSMNDVSDELFDSVVKCARQTEKTRNEFRAVLVLSPKQRNDLNSVSAVVHRARHYLYGCRELIKNNKLDCTSFFEYKNIIEENRRLKQVGTVEADDKLIEEAENSANSMLFLLLEFLKSKLLEAFMYNYPAHKPTPIQFEYLLSVSKAIPYYKDRWNIGLGSWSAFESGAVVELVELLRKYQMWNQINDVFDLERLGQNLEKRGRQDYSSKLFTIKKRISENSELFSEQDQSRFNTNIAVLESAPRRIKRDMETENAIYGILMDVGDTIAQGCAYIGLSNDVLEDKSSEERLNTSWPIVKAARADIAKWAKPFLQQSEMTQGRKKPGSTQFDFQ